MRKGGFWWIVWNATHLYDNSTSLLLFPCTTNMRSSLFIGFCLAIGVILLFIGEVLKALLPFKAQLLYYCKEANQLQK